jgi:PPOX class probable F420-dependent enzyme
MTTSSSLRLAPIGRFAGANVDSHTLARRTEGVLAQLRRFDLPFEKGPLAHLTTLNPNGSPQVTVVWVGIEGEEFVMGHLAMHQKVKNIRRDPRVALSLLGYNTTQGMREYVVIYGTARVTEGGAVPLLQRLAPIYLGPGAEYPPASMRNIPGYVTRIAPARFSGIGPWARQAAGNDV